MVSRRYHVEFSAPAAKQFRKLPGAIQQRLAPRINELAVDPRPHGSKKLSGEEGIFRIRVGDHRVVYSIEDDALVVLVVKIGDRRDVYR